MINLLKIWVDNRKLRIAYTYSVFFLMNIIYTQIFPEIHIALFYFVFPCFVAIGLLSNRKKMHYEGFSFSLPVKNKDVALAKIVFSTSIILLFQITNLVSSIILLPEFIPGVEIIIIGTSLNLIITFTYISVKDISLGWVRRNGITSQRIQVIYMTLLGVVNLGGLLTLKYHKSLNIEWLIEDVKNFWALLVANTSLLAVIFTIAAIILGAVANYTINKRTYFLDD